MERKLFQLHGKVDGIERDVGRDGDGGGREIQNALHAGFDELIDDALGVVGGDGDHREADLMFFHRLHQFADRLNGEGPELSAGLGGIGVEDRREVKTLGVKTLVGAEGTA